MRATADRKTQTPNEPTRGANVSEGDGARAPLDVDRTAIRMNPSRIEGGRLEHVFTIAERHGEADAADAIGDELLTVHDAARVLNVSVSWVYEHTRDDAEDRLPFVKLGKYLRFDRTDLRAYVDDKRAASRRQPRRR